MFNVADRLEILNTINLFTHYLDEQRFDECRECFTPDATAETQGSGTTVVGRDEILQRWATGAERVVAVGGQIRHLITNVAVTSQSDDTATAIAVALLPVVYDRTDLVINATAKYTFQLKKSDDGWRISLFNINLDKPITYRQAS